MAKKPIGALSAAMLDTNEAAPVPAAPAAAEKPVTVTVKLDTQLYRRLKTYGVDHRRTGQDILVAALVDYLNKNG
jgi:hypothetical protein